MDDAPLVMGLDLSLSATGVALPDGRVGSIKTAPSTTIEPRLRLIREKVMERLGATQVAIIEGPFSYGTSSIDLGMVHAAVRLALYDAGLPFVLVSPSALKMYATGKGNATKPDMRMELYKRAGLDVKDDNQVDAWWLRAIGLHLYGYPLLDLPATHTRALAKLLRPVLTPVELTGLCSDGVSTEEEPVL